MYQYFNSSIYESLHFGMHRYFNALILECIVVFIYISLLWNPRWSRAYTNSKEVSYSRFCPLFSLFSPMHIDHLMLQISHCFFFPIGVVSLLPYSFLSLGFSYPLMYRFFTSVSNLCSLCLGDIDASCLFAFSYIQVFFFTSLVVMSFFDNCFLSLSFPFSLVRCLFMRTLTRKYPHVLWHPESSLLYLHEVFLFLLRILQRFGKGCITLFSLLWVNYFNANTLLHRNLVESNRFEIE